MGRTLLHLAAANDQVPVIEHLLIGHEFYLFDKDSFRQTCVDIAVEYSAKTVEKYCRDFLLRRLSRQKTDRNDCTKAHGQDQSHKVKVRNCWTAGKVLRRPQQTSATKVTMKMISSDGAKNKTVSPQPSAVSPTLVVTSPRVKSNMVEVYDDRKGIIYKRIKRAKSAGCRSSCIRNSSYSVISSFSRLLASESLYHSRAMRLPRPFWPPKEIELFERASGSRLPSR